ncbi:hypothetical protein KI387_013178, partial [Taxus chinensis]
RFGRIGRKWNKRPVWTWDIRDKKFRSTRFGCFGRSGNRMHFGTRDTWDEIVRIGRKWNRVHFKFELEKFETKSSRVRDSAGS